MSSIIQRIRENALEFPHSICIQDNNSAITYADLYNELNQISNGLISVLGQENKNIGVYYSRDINYLKAILAIVSAGFCFVSLSQDMPTERLKLIAKDADLSIILCDQKEAWMDCPVYNFENLKKYNTEYRTTCAAPNSHAYILYTSGTTGTPKGVVLTRENLDSAIEAFYNFFKPSKGAVFFASTSFSFDISLLELLLPLYSGGKCIILEREDVINAAELSRLLALHNPDYFQATPSQFRQLALHISSPLKKTIALCGGERMTENLAKILNELFLKSYNMYGPTETTIWAMAWLVKSPDAIELGENLQHANIAVFSIAENKKITEGTGELWISGSAVGKGYYNNPTLTNKSFIIHDGTPYYKTGDIVLLQKGKIYYQHRYDDQLKINGYRIEPGEIENLILSTGLADQVVVVPVLDDDSMPRSLHAFIKPKNNSTQNSINWGEIWDTTYGLLPKNEDEPKTQGWISAKTGENFSPETMHTWLQETVKQIRNIGGDNILEIGHGSGLILSNIAPMVKSYTATEVSKTAHDYVTKYIHHNLPRLNNVHLFVGNNEAFSRRNYDLVIINSVIQYLNTKEKAYQLIIQAYDALKQGGKIFLGDIRNYGLLRQEHKERLAFQNKEFLNAPENIKKILIEDSIIAEHELSFSLHELREFFKLLGAKWTLIRKPKTYERELSHFRYDVIIEKTGTRDHSEVHHAYPQSGLQAPIDLKRLVFKEVSQKFPIWMTSLSISYIDSVPLLPNGKANRKLLSKAAQYSVDTGKFFTPPTTHNEHALYDAIKNILGISRFGMEESFFGLNGRSLQIIYLKEYLIQNYGLNFNLRDFYRNTTLNELAKILFSHEIINARETENLKIAHPLNECQLRIWNDITFRSNSADYWMPFVFLSKKGFDKTRFSNALKTLCNICPNLQMAFMEDDEGPKQKHTPSHSLYLEEVFLHETDLIMNAVDMQRKISPSLEEADVFRVKIMTGKNSETYILFLFHHLIADALSIENIFHLLNSIYNGHENISKKRSIISSPSNTSKQIISDTEYWKEFFRKSYKPANQRQTDIPNNINSISINIDKDLALHVKKLSNKLSITPFTVYYICYAHTLIQQFELKEVIIACDVSNRGEYDTDTLSYYSNIAFLRTPLSLELSRAQMQNAQNNIGEMISHSKTPLHEILELSNNPSPKDYLQFSFAAYDRNVAPLDMQDSQTERLYEVTQHGHFGCTLSLENIGDAAIGCFVAQDSLLNQSELNRLQENFLKMLEKLCFLIQNN